MQTAIQLDRNGEAADLIRSTSRYREGHLAQMPIVGLSDDQIAALFRSGDPAYIAIRLDGKLYGGPEEGGWYYDVQTIEYQAPVRSPEGFQAIVREFRGQRTNEGRYGLGSACSRGGYVISLDATRQIDEPEERLEYQ